jgi:hypothetical protein
VVSPVRTNPLEPCRLVGSICILATGCTWIEAATPPAPARPAQEQNSLALPVTVHVPSRPLVATAKLEAKPEDAATYCVPSGAYTVVRVS